MKTYVGKLCEDGAYRVVIEDERGGVSPLPLRLDLANKSPTGFSWGYSGSGPAQLALALLADAIGEKEALEVYQDFKRDYVAVLPAEWYIPEEDVKERAKYLKAVRSNEVAWINEDSERRNNERRPGRNGPRVFTRIG